MAGLFSLLGDPYLCGAPEPNVLGYFLPGRSGRNRPQSRKRVSSGSDRSQKWVDVVDFRGYDPDTVNCHVQNGKVIIEGQMRKGDADNYTRVESKRTVPIPSDVDPNSVNGQYVSRNFVLVEGKKFPPQVHEVPVQSAGQQRQQLQAGDAPAPKPSDAPAPDNCHASTQASGDAHAYVGSDDDYSSEDEMVNIMRRSSAGPSSVVPATQGGQVSESSSSPQGFVRKVDISGYEPSEISVKRDGNAVTVEAVRETRGPTFTGMEMFRRTVVVPDNADASQLRAAWSDGVLTLMAPYITQPPAEGNAPVSTAAEPPQQQKQEEPEKQEQQQEPEKQEEQQEEQPKQEEQGQAEASSG